MWVRRFFAFALCASAFAACGGKSVQTVGGEAGSPSGCEETLCGDDCVDVTSDRRHCGACFDRCGSNESCVNGRCVGGQVCQPPSANCGGTCVDLSSDPYNCGICHNECFGPCTNGSCAPQCPSGQCGSRCVDFNSDPSNCGGCGFQCSPSQYCSGGRCLGGGCMGAICGGQCVDLSSDPFNCGSCGSVCIGDDIYCQAGLCQSVCPPETLYCNGTCVDWRYDSANCGGCGFRCLGGQECNDGKCNDLCPTGTWCNGVCVDLASDPNNCGQCSSTCSMPNRCVGGMCLGGTGTCGDRVVQSGEEADPPPGPISSVVPLNPMTCRYDFSRITQWYCNGTCGNWGGPADCDQLDADAFCKLKMDNPRSVAVGWSTARASAAPGVCCPPPSYAPGSLGCTTVGVLSSRGVNLAVSVHATDLYSTHQGGTVIVNLVCSN